MKQLISNKVDWSLEGAQYKVEFPNLTFKEDSLRDFLCESLKNMKSSVNNLEDGEVVVLLEEDMMQKYIDEHGFVEGP